VACAHVKGEKAAWENYQPFSAALGNNPIRIITFHEMITAIIPKIKKTLAATEVGRMLQIFRAAGYPLERDGMNHRFGDV
jgi:hypothetical protein